MRAPVAFDVYLLELGYINESIDIHATWQYNMLRVFNLLRKGVVHARWWRFTSR